MKNVYLRYSVIFVYTSLLIFSSWCAFELWRFYCVSVVTNSQPIEYRLPNGVSSKAIAYDLEAKGLLRYPRLFLLITRISGTSRHLYAGGYRWYPGATSAQILHDIANGNVAVESLTVIEGWTLQQMLDLIAQNNYIDHQLAGKSRSEIATLLNIKEKNPEGWFFPDTYYFTWGTSDLEILQNAHAAMQQRLEQAWEQRAPGLPYKTPYQALIVASMIVKEAQYPQEQAMIAGVILSRLHKGMKLQIDPTVVYGMKDHSNNKISTKSLRTPTAYNTYTQYGLPPTPISLPGEMSLIAALHPEITPYLYFVAKGDGTHEFSTTLQAHDAAVKKYILHQG